MRAPTKTQMVSKGGGNQNCVPVVLMGDVQCRVLDPSLCPVLPRCPMRSLAQLAGWRLHPEAPAACGCWRTAPGALHCWVALAFAWGLQALSTLLLSQCHRL